MPQTLEPPRSACGCSEKGRNLVVCIDGTSNKFGKYNTNVVELYSHIIKNREQLTYYNSGVGTYANKPLFSFGYLRQQFESTVDLAIAWNFDKVLLGAYRWLSDNYEENDRIYLFGFSRGAYQVRSLAGMIRKVGLIHKGNEEQIPFAYELYMPNMTAATLFWKMKDRVKRIAVAICIISGVGSGAGAIIVSCYYTDTLRDWSRRYWEDHLRYRILSTIFPSSKMGHVIFWICVFIYLLSPFLFKYYEEQRRTRRINKSQSDDTASPEDSGQSGGTSNESQPNSGSPPKTPEQVSWVLKMVFVFLAVGFLFIWGFRQLTKLWHLCWLSEEELDNPALAERFKDTFSREDVRVHFVGVWDTVSSVGITQGDGFPYTDTTEHICYFRHALALDERRVKFLPEYVCHGDSLLLLTNGTSSQPSSTGTQSPPACSPHVKEVWFAGNHSDVGGGNPKSRSLNLIPYDWMVSEAVPHGLRMKALKERPLEPMSEAGESLRGLWRVFEYLPIKRLSYENKDSTTRIWHRGQPRKIRPGQMIHPSLAFCPDSYYTTKTQSTDQGKAAELVRKRPNHQSEEEEILNYIKDLFNLPEVKIEMDEAYIRKLRNGKPTSSEGGVVIAGSGLEP